jgi:hypothetical protein
MLSGITIIAAGATVLLMLHFQNEGISVMPEVDDASVSSTTASDSVESVNISHGHAAQAVIEFPDNNPIKITWRRPDGANPPLNRDDWGYETLKTRAESGDEHAAFFLSALLKQCGQAFESEGQMQAAIDNMDQTHTIRFPGTDYESHIRNPERDIPLLTKGIRKLFDSCYGITAEQKMESSDWLQRSADGDHVPAIIEIANREEDNEIAIRQFTQAWDAGEGQVLLELSERYYANYQSGVEPTDKIRGYAALYLYTRIVEAGMGPDTGHGEIAGRQVAQAQQTLDRATADMLAHEIDEAIVLARSMIDENPNCCFGM